MMSIPEEYMMPCLNKKYLGIECMGCGMQRSLSLLFQGEFTAAFYMYPAIYTLIMLVGFALLNSFRNYKYGTKIILTLGIINVLLIVGNYVSKFF